MFVLSAKKKPDASSRRALLSSKIDYFSIFSTIDCVDEVGMDFRI